MYDTTDPFLAFPTASELNDYMKVVNTHKRIIFRYRECSSVDITPSQQFVREAEQRGLFANQVQEKRKARAFKKGLAQLLSNVDTTSVSTHSSIFDPVVNELKKLSNIKNVDRKMLILYSDLMDNTVWVSFYRHADKKLLYGHSPHLVQRFATKLGHIKRDSTISIHVIYQPRDVYDSERYKHLRWLWSEVFTAHNISISFSANLSDARMSP